MSWINLQSYQIILISLIGIYFIDLITKANSLKDVTLYYNITEEKPNGTFIANIYADAEISKNHEASKRHKLQYQFLSQPEMIFDIEKDTGIIRVGKQIDRDYHCPNENICRFDLYVAIRIPDPFELLQLVKVIIIIKDINDNRPKFVDEQVNLNILESALTGKSFTLPTASDPDSSSNGIQGYKLSSSSNKFALFIKDKLDGSQELILTLHSKLDREQKENYILRINAHDGGYPPLTGGMDVFITVLDANDHYPEFEKPLYNISISENVPVETTIVIVSAKDKDIKQNSKISYKFSDSTVKKYGHIFRMNNDTGAILTRHALDYESTNIFQLTVIAEDHGSEPLANDSTVIINVLDVNDNAPKIVVHSLAASGSGLAVIAEDADAGTILAHIMVSDPDTGRNGQFSCTLNTDFFKLITLKEDEFQIVTNTFLNREIISQYKIMLECTDFGENPQIGQENIEVVVVDINDNEPLFAQQTYTAEIKENNNIDAFILQVSASDKDTGKNSDIFYLLDMAVQDSFLLNIHTGVLTAKRSLDHEKHSSISFRVYACDNGIPQKNSSALIDIYVIDINDEKPVFGQPRYTFRTQENGVSNMKIGQVTALDHDSYPFNIIHYSIKQDEGRNFFIDSESGHIFTVSTLDREKRSIYNFIVTASNEDKLELQSSVHVSVLVMDINDNAPIMIFPTKNNNSITISNQAPLGYMVGQLKAYDIDTGNNSQLLYWFSKGNDDGFFVIDHATGKIYINQQLNKFNYKHFEFKMLIHDEGKPRKNVFSKLHVFVNSSLPFYNTRIVLNSDYGLKLVYIIAGLSIFIAFILVLCIIYLFSKNTRRKKNIKTIEELYHTDVLKEKTFVSNTTPPCLNDYSAFRDINRNRLNQEAIEEQKKSNVVPEEQNNDLDKFSNNVDTEEDKKILLIKTENEDTALLTDYSKPDETSSLISKPENHYVTHSLNRKNRGILDKNTLKKNDYNYSTVDRSSNTTPLLPKTANSSQTLPSTKSNTMRSVKFNLSPEIANIDTDETKSSLNDLNLHQPNSSKNNLYNPNAKQHGIYKPLSFRTAYYDAEYYASLKNRNSAKNEMNYNDVNKQLNSRNTLNKTQNSRSSKCDTDVKPMNIINDVSYLKSFSNPESGHKNHNNENMYNYNNFPSSPNTAIKTKLPLPTTPNNSFEHEVEVSPVNTLKNNHHNYGRLSASSDSLDFATNESTVKRRPSGVRYMETFQSK